MTNLKLLVGSSVQSQVLDLDQSLMMRVKQGDRNSFTLLFEKFKSPIMSYLKTWIQDSNAAEELCQEVFLKVYRSRESWTPQAKFSTWLWTIARNTALDHLQKKKEVLAFADSDEDGGVVGAFNELESPLSNAEGLLIEAMEEQEIQRCISTLSITEREILSLRIFSELSYEDIANQVGLPVGTIKTSIFRSKKKLTDSFKKGKG